MNDLNTEHLEKLIIKTLLLDKSYLVAVSSTFLPEYFEDQNISNIFGFIKSYHTEYGSLPDQHVIINSLKNQEEVVTVLNEINSIDLNIAASYEYIFNETNKYLKRAALKEAIIRSAEIVNKNGNFDNIEELIKSAIIKDLKIDIGVDYFKSLKERLHRMISSSEHRIPTYYPTLDEILCGGFPAYTLNVIVAQVHGWKSATGSNISTRQVLHGHEIAVATAEMAEDAYCQRYDSTFTGLDINRIYIFEETKKKLINKLGEIYKDKNRGNLYIKQFPTGETSRNDIRRWLKELELRGIKLDKIYIDYLNLMKSASLSADAGLYGNVKRISEELRSLSFEFNAPVLTMSQLNRPGQMISFSEVDFTHISESMGVPATADFMMIFGRNYEDMIYQNELAYKIVKNRLGGRVGEIRKFYIDTRSLRMYDETELEVWLRDIQTSGDSRELFVREE
jgi:replicative DNA helicase